MTHTSVARTPERLPVSAAVQVEPWPSERPLYILNVIVGLLLWAVTLVSIIGIVYAGMIGLLLLALQLAFVAHLRGSGIRVSEQQLPEIHAAVTRLSARFGMAGTPETYVIHGGGVLNALATRFAGRDIVVLFSDLLDACEGNDAARDMIIAHELGHLHRGHLRWAFLLAPAAIVPFLGSTLSRAREYTCDRYGLAGAGDAEGAVFGLTVLAAGRRLAPQVDRRALAAQREQLDTGLMTLGTWLSTHPPLSRRLAQLDPSLASTSPTAINAGRLRAAAILASVTLPIVLAGIAAATLLPALLEPDQFGRHRETYEAPPPEIASAQVRADLERLAAFVHDEALAGRGLPWDTDELYERWAAAHPTSSEPRDPYDGYRYGYEQKGEHFRIWSTGPDADRRNAELLYDSRRTQRPPAADGKPDHMN